MSESVTIPEKIVNRKVIVFKSRLDLNTIRRMAEKMKTKLFVKFLFIKPKQREIRIVSIDKYYEPYVVIDGKYTIEYTAKWFYYIHVDETMQEIILFGKTVKPEPIENPEIPRKVIKLTGEGRFRYKKKAHMVFDRQWREVGCEQLPYVPFEEQSEKILNKLEKFGNFRIPAEKEIDMLRANIAQRPKDIIHVHDELFTVQERAVIYKPMFKIEYQNLKTGKEATAIIDAVTGQTHRD